MFPLDELSKRSASSEVPHRGINGVTGFSQYDRCLEADARAGSCNKHVRHPYLLWSVPRSPDSLRGNESVIFLVGFIGPAGAGVGFLAERVASARKPTPAPAGPMKPTRKMTLSVPRRLSGLRGTLQRR